MSTAMTRTGLKPALVACALALACAAAAAQTSTPKDKAATEAQLEAARADLDRAARRVAELSRQLGRDEEGPFHVFSRRIERRPVLGVVLAPDAQNGVRIAGVTPDSAAAKAGLKAGDRIVRIDGKDVLGSNGELRVENARKLLDDLDTKTPVQLAYMRGGRTSTVNVTPQLDADVIMVRTPERIRGLDPGVPGVAPKIRSEVFRIGPHDCEGKDCKVPALVEAFRWNGFNLASVDPQLGRYFGTDRGVLVLSNGELEGLQAGDVIQKIDGKAVRSPRETMDALRDKPADALVLVEYLRDRKVASTRVKVPKAMPFRIPAPPPPPAPPAPPKAPPAPPAPPAAFEDGDVVLHDVRIAIAPEAVNLPAPPAPPEWTGEDVHIHVR